MSSEDNLLALSIDTPHCYLFTNVTKAADFLNEQFNLSITTGDIENAGCCKPFKGYHFIPVSVYSRVLALSETLEVNSKTLTDIPISAMEIFTGEIIEYPNLIMFCSATTIHLKALRAIYTGVAKMLYVGSYVVRHGHYKGPWPPERSIESRRLKIEDIPF